MTPETVFYITTEEIKELRNAMINIDMDEFDRIMAKIQKESIARGCT